MTTGCLRATHGLVNMHAYTLLDLIELTQNGRVVHRLVKLRNPWARETYTGPFSDDSSDWTDDFRRQAGHRSANDGVIMVPVEIYMRAFNWVSIAITENFAATQQIKLSKVKRK